MELAEVYYGTPESMAEINHNPLTRPEIKSAI